MVEGIERSAGRVVITAAAVGREGRCPGCGTSSARVHSRYRRRVADAPIGGTPVAITLGVRRLFCDAPDCPKRTFAEQIPGLTCRYARRSLGLGRMLAAVGLALAGRAAARLGARLGLAASRTTLLRMIRGLPDPPVGAVAVLGVDDFALRRGHVYGTVLIDMDTHRPVDLLPDREADTLAGVAARASRRGGGVPGPGRRLRRGRGHRRTRGGAGRRPVAPVAQPRRTRGEDGGPPPRLLGPAAGRGDRPPAEPDAPTGPPAARRAGRARPSGGLRAGYPDPGALCGGAGSARSRAKGSRPSCGSSGLAKETVRRFARAGSVEDLLATARDGRSSVLDEFKPYLHHRFNLGHTNGSALFAEIRAPGLPRQPGHRAGLPAPVPGPGRRATGGAPTAHRAGGDRRDPAPPRPPRCR